MGRTSPRTITHSALMRYAKMLGFGEIHTRIDNETGMHAIIAIHDLTLGPAIGGCRYHTYNTTGPALKDALRLAYMMTLKAAVSDLPHGGAKSVILKTPETKDRNALFESFGNFVHELDGRYIAAVDVGTSETDMDSIAKNTPYVIGTTIDHDESNPSPYTAKGVLRGIQAAVKYKLKRDTLVDVHVAIQGAGHVAYYLSKFLHERGACITVCDTKEDAAQIIREKFGANVVNPDNIYDVECDVFAPCALGGIIDTTHLNRITAKIIAGAANNQLAHHKFGRLMHKKGILYAPDFVINSGGLIYAAAMYDYNDKAQAIPKIDKLYDTLMTLFERSVIENKPTTHIAEKLAKEKLNANK